MREAVSMALVAVLVGLGVGAPGSASAASAGETVAVAQIVADLRVEPASTAAFDRALFFEDQDIDADGCTTREELLELEGTNVVAEDCITVNGTWYSWMDDITIVDDQTQLALDSLVDLPEAWRSGAHGWTANQRTMFANDLSIPETLSLVTTEVDAAKADRDPSAWLPDLLSVRCRYVSEWVVVKYRWNLAVDQDEKDAIDSTLAGCGLMTVAVPPFPADRPSSPEPLPAPVPDVTYVTTKYDSVIYAVTATKVTALTFAQWKAAGAPKPTPAMTTYYKYAWSGAILADTAFSNGKSKNGVHLTATQWSKAGRPSPRLEWDRGLVYYQWAGSSEILVRVDYLQKSVFRVTGPQWKASGYHSFSKRANQGYVKLSWDDSIAFLTDYANGAGRPITGAQWKAAGNPTPAVKARFPGDQVWQYTGSSTLYYSGPTVSRSITFNEWRAMGFPRPTVRGSILGPPPIYPPTRPTSDLDCSDFDTWEEAQREYERLFPYFHDIYGLDSDDDRIACEGLLNDF